MRTIDSPLKEHLADSVTSLATCWRITRTDGVVEGYTDHDIDLSFDGTTYKSSGISQTASSQSMSITTDNLEVHGLIASTSPINTIASKLYDSAKVEVFQVNYKSLPATVTKTSVIWIKRGIVGDVELKQGKWVVEVRGLMQFLKQRIGDKTSRLCRAAEFGDKNCRADLSLYSKNGTVTSYSGRTIYTDIAGLSVNDAKLGKMTFTNNSVSFDILSSSGGAFQLAEQISFDPTNLDVYVVFGCNHWIDDCKKRNNMDNYYGEPNVPTEGEWAAGYFDKVSL